MYAVLLQDYECLQTEEKFCQAFEIHIERLKSTRDKIVLDMYISAAKKQVYDSVVDEVLQGLAFCDDLIRISYPQGEQKTGHESGSELSGNDTDTEGTKKNKKKRFIFRRQKSNASSSFEKGSSAPNSPKTPKTQKRKRFRLSLKKSSRQNLKKLEEDAAQGLQFFPQLAMPSCPQHTNTWTVVYECKEIGKEMRLLYCMPHGSSDLWYRCEVFDNIFFNFLV